MPKMMRATIIQIMVWACIGIGVGLIGWQMLVYVPPADESIALVSPDSEMRDTMESELPAATPVAWMVYVSGAVRAPGLYVVQPTWRVGQVLQQAGGLTDDADVDAINLAEPLSDAMHVRVPRLSQAVTQAIVEEEPVVAKMRINDADTTQLDALPGIGPSLAQRIVAYRDAHGPFVDAQALAAVPGIGAKLVANLEDLVVYH